MTYLLLLAAAALGMGLALVLQARLHPHIDTLLTLSGGFLLSVTVSEIMPEIYDAMGRRAAAWILAGLLMQILIDFFSKGFEHGHTHRLSGRGGRTVAIALFIHAVFDGIPAATHPDFLNAILLHKIPISFMLAALLVRDRTPKIELIAVLLLFAMAAPLGAYLSTLSWVTNHRNEALGLACGMFLHIASTIVFESADKDHKFDLLKMTALLLGLALGLVQSQLLG